jgi:hypothetical protein
MMNWFKQLLPSKKQESNFEETVRGMNQSLLTVLAPDNITEYDSYVRVGANYTRSLLIVDYDPVQDQNKIQQVTEIPENVSIINYVQEYHTGEVRSQLVKSIKQNRMKMNTRFADENTMIDSQGQIDSASEMLKNLAYRNDKIFLFHTLIHLVASSTDELDQLTTTVKSKFSKIGIIHNPTDRAIDAFRSFLPLNENKVDELTYKMSNSEAISYFFPFHENEMFSQTGLIKGRNMTTGNVVIVDDTKLLNRHEFVIGISGIGKSTYLFANMTNKHMLGRKIITIDPKGEFGRNYADLGGAWVKFQLKGGNRINPLDLPKVSEKVIVEETEFGNILLTKISNLLVMFRLMYNSMTDLQEEILSSYIQKVYAEKGITDATNTSALTATDYPTLQDLYELIGKDQTDDPYLFDTVRDFYTTLKTYVTGMYSELFNGHTNISIDNDLVCYDLKEMSNNEKIQRILFYNILSHTTYEIMSGDREPSEIFIDEAHVIADPKVPKAMEFIYFMMKVLRSFNCGITTASQSVEDFLSARDENRNYGKAIITQSVQRLYLPMSEEELKYLEEELGNTFSKGERETLILKDGKKKEQAGKGIFYTGSKKIKLEVQLNEVTEMLWFDQKSINDITI